MKRTLGMPSLPQVASAIASGRLVPAATSTRNHRVNRAIGSSVFIFLGGSIVDAIDCSEDRSPPVAIYLTVPEIGIDTLPPFAP